MNEFNAKFGQLTLDKGPENNFFWSGYLENLSDFFSDKIPICLFTKEKKISKDTIDFIEEIVTSGNQYLEEAILFLKKTLIEQRKKYKITNNEYLLILDNNYCPVNEPEFIFYEDSQEWLIKFSEGIFSICDPFGISVTFSSKKPISVDNLEDSEFID